VATDIESAWPQYPGYRIVAEPCPAVARAVLDGVVIAESDACLVLRETKHVDRLYFPEGSVRWELLEPTDHHTVCPFKGEASYWTLRGSARTEENVVWAYRDPFPEVAAIAGHVCFYEDRLRVELDERWPDGSVVTTRFPTWGDATELVRLIDVEPAGDGHFVGPAYGYNARNVVEGGQLLAEAIVAATRSVPGQRVTQASMVFGKAASFDAPIDLTVEIPRAGRSFSTVRVGVAQEGVGRAEGLVLLGADAPDLFRDAVAMPAVAGPESAVTVDWGVTGRDLRVVDAAYDPDPDRVGPPEIFTWVRFRDAPERDELHAGLVAQSMGHWTIAAAMRPHAGFGERDAHRRLSTGVMAITVAFHDPVDVSEWLLYATRAIWSGRGLAQGDGRVFTREGRLVASFSTQVMIRAFAQDPAAIGHTDHTAM
jgi:acyl-CoA thioesterase-2